MRYFLDFEKPIAALEGKIEELRRSAAPTGIDVDADIRHLSGLIDREIPHDL